jgi:hypothetical protein
MECWATLSIGQALFKGGTYGGRNTHMFCVLPYISFLGHLYKVPILPDSEYPLPFPTCCC